MITEPYGHNVVMLVLTAPDKCQKNELTVLHQAKSKSIILQGLATKTILVLPTRLSTVPCRASSDAFAYQKVGSTSERGLDPIKT